MGRGNWAKRTAGKAVKQVPLSEFEAPACREATQGDLATIGSAYWSSESLIAGDRRAIGCMGATEFAPKIRKRYQTNELAVDSTEFGTTGVGGSNPLSPDQRKSNRAPNSRWGLPLDLCFPESKSPGSSWLCGPQPRRKLGPQVLPVLVQAGKFIGGAILLQLH